MVQRWRRVLRDNLLLSTELIIKVSHRKEFLKPMFRDLAFRQSETSRLLTLSKAKSVSRDHILSKCI